MYVKIPFESTIDFKSNIAEITKMSLEHDFNVSEGIVLGNFYISGEYKSLDVSVNTEPFKYTLPFTVELSSDIREDSLEFNIEDFSYDILDKNSLKVYIEYSLKGEVREEEKVETERTEDTKDDEVTFERVNEDELNSELEFIDEFLNQKEIETKKDDKEVKEDKEERIEEDTIEETSKNVIKEDAINKDRLNEESEKTIMETIKDSDDTFVTYHVHIVKESESLETIANYYNVPSNLLMEYNNVDSVNMGDKILIPKADE